jgi:hypothetical protein
MKKVSKLFLFSALAAVFFVCSSSTNGGPNDSYNSDCASCVHMIKVNITLNSGKMYSGYVASYAQELCTDCIDSYLPENGKNISPELWPQHLSYYKKIFETEDQNGEREFVSRKKFLKDFSKEEIKEIKLLHAAGNSYSSVQLVDEK